MYPGKSIHSIFEDPIFLNILLFFHVAEVMFIVFFFFFFTLYESSLVFPIFWYSCHICGLSTLPYINAKMNKIVLWFSWPMFINRTMLHMVFYVGYMYIKLIFSLICDCWLSHTLKSCFWFSSWPGSMAALEKWISKLHSLIIKSKIWDIITVSNNLNFCNVKWYILT